MEPPSRLRAYDGYRDVPRAVQGIWFGHPMPFKHEEI
jgi:hypothetical protein